MRKKETFKNKQLIEIRNKQILKFIAIVFLTIVICIGFMLYSSLPALSDFRNSICGTILNLLFTTAFISFLTFSKIINMPILGKITVWIYLGLKILFQILDWGIIEVIFLFIYSILNIAITIYLYITTKKQYESVWIFGAFSYLSISTITFRVHYINGDWPLMILIPSVIVAIIALIFCFIYAIQKYTEWKNLISLSLVGLMVGFILAFVTISSMNIYLDTSNPTYEEFVIVDKNVRNGVRKITTYNLKVQNRDKVFTIGVSEEIYYDFEVKDEITLSIYSGAFNESYYIYENTNN